MNISLTGGKGGARCGFTLGVSEVRGRGWTGVTEHGDGGERKSPVTQHAWGYLTRVGAGKVSNVRKFRRSAMDDRH